jgi:hypothetical protein
MFLKTHIEADFNVVDVWRDVDIRTEADLKAINQLKKAQGQALYFRRRALELEEKALSNKFSRDSRVN